MDGWSKTQQMIVYKDKLLKKSSNKKSKLVLSSCFNTGQWSLHGFQTLHFICYLFDCKLWFHRFRIMPDIISKLWHTAIWNCFADQFKSEQTPSPGGKVTFHLLPIGLQTLVAIYSESYQKSLSCLCAPPSEVAVLFQVSSNLSRRPYLGQVIDLDLLLCTGFNLEHVVLFLCHTFTQRPMSDQTIERSNGRCFDLQQLLANSTEIFISHEKKSDLSLPEIYKALKPFFDSWTESVLQEW